MPGGPQVFSRAERVACPWLGAQEHPGKLLLMVERGQLTLQGRFEGASCLGWSEAPGWKGLVLSREGRAGDQPGRCLQRAGNASHKKRRMERKEQKLKT